MSEQLEAEHKLEALKLLLSRMTDESDALWARFNYLTAVQLALLAAYGLTWREVVKDQSLVLALLFISVLGLTIGGLSIRTVSRLRSWHKYWENRSRELDKDLSTNHGFPKLFPTEKFVVKPSRTLTGPIPILAAFTSVWCLSVLFIIRDML